MSDKSRREIMRDLLTPKPEPQSFLTTPRGIELLAAQGIDIRDVARLGGYDGFRVIGPVTATEIQAARDNPDWLADIDRRLAKPAP